MSKEFDPLEPDDIPVARLAGWRELACYEVAARLRKIRKPKSMSPGTYTHSLLVNSLTS